MTRATAWAAGTRTAIIDRVLRTPMLVRAPLPLFRSGLGWVLAGRFLRLTHTGRRSGLPREAVLEVIGRPDPPTYRVVAGLGRQAQWLRNVERCPDVLLDVGWHRAAPAVARVLAPRDGAAALSAYAAAHPAAWGVLGPVLDRHVAPGDVGYSGIPVVDLTLVDGGRAPGPVGRSRVARTRSPGVEERPGQR